MRINTLKDRFHYVPNRLGGSSLFSGKPTISSDLQELLEKEDIAYIQKILSDIIEMRKRLFGTLHPEYYGLFEVQRIVDLKKKLIIKAISDTNDADFSLSVSLKVSKRFFSRNSNVKALKDIQSGEDFHPVVRVAKDHPLFRSFPWNKNDQTSLESITHFPIMELSHKDIVGLYLGNKGKLE